MKSFLSIYTLRVFDIFYFVKIDINSLCSFRYEINLVSKGNIYRAEGIYRIR